MPLPAIDIDTLLTDKEENLKLEQISTTHPGILDLLGDPGNPLYAEPHSMAKHFDAMMLGAHSVGQLPNQGCCRDPEALAPTLILPTGHFMQLYYNPDAQG